MMNGQGLELDRAIVERYLRQPSGLPEGVRRRAREALGGEVRLYALLDLDERLLLTEAASVARAAASRGSVGPSIRWSFRAPPWPARRSRRRTRGRRSDRVRRANLQRGRRGW